MFTTLPTLDAATASAVDEAARRALASDGVWPLNEAGRTAVADAADHPVQHWVGWDDDRVRAYAQLDSRDASVQMFVDPAHRMRGNGTDLMRVVLKGDRQPSAWWAFGNLPGARILAQKQGLRNRRELLIMRRELDGTTDIEMPAGYELTSYRPDDLEAMHAVNAASFAGHPEQGLVTTAELASKITDPDEILLARDESDVAGFHWTKLHDATTGEVYVIAVHPDHGGAGLGRALLEAGLNHLAAQGASQVELYVEATNERVVRLYKNAGFTVTSRDVAYSH